MSPRASTLGAKVDPHLSGSFRRLAVGSGLHFSAQIAGNACKIAAAVVLARIAGPGGYGLVMLAVAVQKIGSQMGTVGLGNALLRLIPRVERASWPHVLRLSGALTGAGAVAVGVAVSLGSRRIDALLNGNGDLRPLLLVSAFVIPLLAWGHVAVSFTRGAGKLLTMLASIVAEPGALLVALVAVAALDLGLSGAISAYVVSGVALIAVGLWGGARLLRSPAEELDQPPGDLEDLRLRGVMRVALPMLSIALVTHVTTWMDTLMLGGLATADTVGIYNAASRVPLTIPMLLTAVNAVFAPTISRLYATGQRDELSRLYKQMTQALLLAALPVSIVAFVAAEPLLAVFGPEFVAAAPVLRILAMAQLVNVGVGSVGFLLSMTNYHNVVLANSILIVAINAGLDLLLIPRFGAVGAAVASGTSIVVSNTVRLAFVGALLKMSPFAGRQTVLVLVTGAAAMLAGMLTLAAASDSALWLGGGLAAAVAIAVYGLGIHMLVERGLVRGIPKLGVLLQRRVHR